MYKVGIIGTGKIGSHLAEYLLHSKFIKEIHLTNRNDKSLNGRKLSLELHKHIINAKVKIKNLDWNNLNDLNLIVVCVKDKYDPRELMESGEFPVWFPKNLRFIGLFKDLPILQSLAIRLNEYKGKIAVITNPVEITSCLLSRWIPSSHVFGLGASLDAERLSFVITESIGKRIKSDICLIAGERGNEMFSISHLWKRNKMLRNLSLEETQNFIRRSKEIGFKVMNDLGFTLHDCVPTFAKDIEWLLIENKSKYRSFAIGDRNCFISQPIIYKTVQTYKPFDDFTYLERTSLEKIKLRLQVFLNQLNLINYGNSY